MFNVLFVCTGNVCRSPIAEGLLRSWLERDMVPNVTVSSAGTFASDGAPASTYGVMVAAEHGFDTSGHHARLLHRELIHRADLILTMEVDHIYEILRLSPNSESKIHPLGGYNLESDAAALDLTIFDPIGGEMEDYRRCYAIIEHHLARSYPAIRRAISDAARSARKQGE
jgi:protein-tyrosine phosphatase